ncbi:MAG: thiamine phosphate synthase [Bacteroidetes bacterium]|nr:thiamine phosphate synthase [Bacteroidota bacterium]
MDEKLFHRFQYLTQDLDTVSHEQLTLEACQAGVQWLQLRMKNKPEDESLQIAKKVKNICQSYGCRLIINDHVSLALEVNAGGVHLGKTDMSIGQARDILGKDKIIGGTANTFEEVQTLAKQGVNYIGVGPFRFTATKQNLSRVLGLKGYQTIIEKCKAEAIQIPIIAIGGITLEDVEDIRQTGVHGIAVSSAINLSADRTKSAKLFLQALQKRQVFIQ